MKTIKTAFYLIESKTNDKGEAPVYFRIKFKPALNLSTGIFLKPNDWDKNKQKIKSKHSRSFELNKKLKQCEEKVQETMERLSSNGDQVSREKIKMIWQNKSEEILFLMPLVDYFINHKTSIKYRDNTLRNYKSFKKKLEHFLRYRYSLSDVRLNNLNYDFIIQFEGFLSTIYKNRTNTIAKNADLLRTIINFGLKLGWLKTYPFFGHKCKLEAPQPKYLTLEELNRIESLDLSKCKGLRVIGDLFLFTCYTGLSYSDMRNLKEANISIINGEEFLEGARQKTTGEYCGILFPKAKAILEKYKNSPLIKTKGYLLPSRCNQTMNRGLKKIAGIVGIGKNLTCHVGRHAFATLSGEHGVPLESVSKTLGHSSIRTTQAYYAKVTSTKLSRDYQCMKSVF